MTGLIFNITGSSYYEKVCIFDTAREKDCIRKVRNHEQNRQESNQNMISVWHFSSEMSSGFLVILW